MSVVVFAKSDSLKQHIQHVVPQFVSFCVDLHAQHLHTGVHLIHANAFTYEQISAFLRQHPDVASRVAIVDDRPDVGRMLRFTELGAGGYCNAYMARAHYEQLINLLREGQSWYPPQLLAQALSLAHASIRAGSGSDSSAAVLDVLTPRQQQIAEAIAAGKSNKAVAEEHGISERTVKSHLTQIYEKLGVDDRVALILLLQNKAAGAAR